MNIRPSFVKAHLALIAVALFYGINYFTLKGVFNENYDSFALLAIRNIAGVSFFALFHYLFIKEKIKDRKDLGRLALCALFGISINQIFFLWGLSNTSKVHSSVLMITTPVFVFLVARLLSQETISLRKVMGLLLSFAGAVILILLGSKAGGSTDDSTITGDLMIMINAASYGVYLVLVKPLVVKYNTFTIIKWIFIFGAIPNISLGIGPLMATDFSHLSFNAAFGIGWLVIFATFGAYFLNAWAMKQLPASSVGVYIYVQPVFVTLGAAILGSGEVNVEKIIMILLIFAGVYLVTQKRKEK